MQQAQIHSVSHTNNIADEKIIIHNVHVLSKNFVSNLKFAEKIRVIHKVMVHVDV